MTKKPLTEDDAIKNAQDAFGALKSALSTIQSINTDAGRFEAANAAMGLRGEVITLHTKATEALYKYYPEQAGAIVTRGGGGR